MKWCSVTFAAVMFADCVVVSVAAVNFGQFVDDAAAVVWAASAAALLANVLGLVVAAAVLPAVTDVVELPAAAVLPAVTDVVVLPAAAASAAVVLTSLASVAVLWSLPWICC